MENLHIQASNNYEHSDKHEREMLIDLWLDKKPKNEIQALNIAQSILALEIFPDPDGFEESMMKWTEGSVGGGESYSGFFRKIIDSNPEFKGRLMEGSKEEKIQVLDIIKNELISNNDDNQNTKVA